MKTQSNNTENSTDVSSSETRQKIIDEILDTYEAYHVYPHMAMVPDFFLRYWDLAEACAEHFDFPFHKPKLASQYK
jgi:hypothetical protein